MWDISRAHENSKSSSKNTRTHLAITLQENLILTKETSFNIVQIYLYSIQNFVKFEKRKSSETLV